jgi:hypothetical protein
MSGDPGMEFCLVGRPSFRSPLIDMHGTPLPNQPAAGLTLSAASCAGFPGIHATPSDLL